MRWLLPFLAIAPLHAQSSLPALDGVIESAIQKGEVPGVVCLVGYKNRILHFKAYGSRALEPAKEAMTKDTIFDAASLTKVVATTSSILKLIEDGKVRLNDPVTAYLPKFQGGKTAITVRHLLTHYSGLRPDLDLEPAWSGYELGIEKALVDKPVAEPGAKFIYSDINFILLGEIVRQVSGLPLNEFAKQKIFEPLGMSETGYLPDPALKPRITPTEKLKGEEFPLRGVVHDETTRFMGGVAGHAGVFTTAEDLAKFARMILSKGGGLLSPLTIAAATRAQSPPGMPALRGLGWDIDSPFAGNRGDLYPIGSFGHTGFTGTSLWIDPASESYVIVLGNHVHPYRRTPITALRGRVASVAAAHVSRLRAQESKTIARGRTLTGLDVLAQEKFARLASKRVGLITNHTGVSREGKRNIDLMVAAKVNVKAIFSPEHGITGKLDQEGIKDSIDPATKIPVISLYKTEDRRPEPAILKTLDALVFDIQDVGARFYTYGCTLKNAMEAAAAANVEVIVLDRPNPITGRGVEGPMIPKEEMSFVGCLPLPLRHGLTIGELARFANDRIPKRARLSVVPMKEWTRDMWFDETGLYWISPSPNMRSLYAALLFPGIAMIEYSKNYSVGRGTDAPFELLGGNFMNGAEVARELAKADLPGVAIYPTRISPASSNLAGMEVEGIRLIVTDRNAVRPTDLGLHLMATIRRLYPKAINFWENRKLIGDPETIRRLTEGEAAEVIQKSWKDALASYVAEREKYLIYN
jgi:uncharacterized protein YbbC (DUF1343 family)/CubicO group peptidase (beta-lactamase class C family)